MMPFLLRITTFCQFKLNVPHLTSACCKQTNKHDMATDLFGNQNPSTLTFHMFTETAHAITQVYPVKPNMHTPLK